MNERRWLVLFMRWRVHWTMRWRTAGQRAYSHVVLLSPIGNDRWLLGIATDASNSEDLRGHALWTAGQAGIPGADLAALYDKLTDSEVKEKLIWVLSESKDRVATDKLVEIAQKDRDIEMKKKALFWLGQKNDPRVRQILTDILIPKP